MRVLAAAVVLLLAATPVTFAQSAPPQRPGAKPAPAAAKGAPAAPAGFAQLRGVLLEASGTPAVRHQLALRSDNGDLFTSGPTAADGSFVLPGLPPGSYRVVAVGPDGTEFAVANGTLTLGAGKVERVELRIAGSGAAPGRTAPSAPAKKGAIGRLLGSTGGKIALGAVGVAAVALVIAGGDDDEPSPVSPSRP